MIMGAEVNSALISVIVPVYNVTDPRTQAAACVTLGRKGIARSASSIRPTEACRMRNVALVTGQRRVYLLYWCQWLGECDHAGSALRAMREDGADMAVCHRYMAYDGYNVASFYWQTLRADRRGGIGADHTGQAYFTITNAQGLSLTPFPNRSHWTRWRWWRENVAF